MALMTKSDLEYDDYSWTAYGDDDPEVTGEPDSTLFNRNEGYEVLYLINKMAEIHMRAISCLITDEEPVFHILESIIFSIID